MAIEGGSENLNLDITGEVSEILESRGILAEDLKLVIHNAETNGQKLYKPDTSECLAKMRIAETNFFVHYSTNGGNDFLIHSAYYCRSDFEE